MDKYKLFLENIDKNGLLPTNNAKEATAINSQQKNQNFFSITANTPFGNLTHNAPNKNSEKLSDYTNHSTKAINGFDTDILTNSKFKKIDDTTLKLKIKIARLQAELEEHKKLVESTFLKAERNQYQKLLEIQQKMETELQRLVAEYQHRQLHAIVFSPFTKLFHFIKNYVVLK